MLAASFGAYHGHWMPLDGAVYDLILDSEASAFEDAVQQREKISRKIEPLGDRFNTQHDTIWYILNTPTAQLE